MTTSLCGGTETTKKEQEGKRLQKADEEGKEEGKEGCKREGGKRKRKVRGVLCL